MEYDLRHVHDANLKILLEVDRICRKYKIQYALDAGTLIGAIRHKGFIPWDDDADIAFTRDYYERFEKVVRQELPDTMELLCPEDLRNGTVFYDFTPRIIYKASKVHDDNNEMKYYDGKLNHLWVDLFIMDRLPDGKLASNLVLLQQKIIYGAAMGHRFELDMKKYTPFHKIAVGLLAGIGKLIPMKVLYKIQERLSRRYQNNVTSRYYYSNYQPDYLYVILKNSWCENVEDAQFCDTKLMIPSGWHEVLHLTYGDYLKLPPKEQRVPAHSSIKIQVDNEEI